MQRLTEEASHEILDAFFALLLATWISFPNSEALRSLVFQTLLEDLQPRVAVGALGDANESMSSQLTGFLQRAEVLSSAKKEHCEALRLLCQEALGSGRPFSSPPV